MNQPVRSRRRPSAVVVWRTAIRPFAYSASALPLLVGFAMARSIGVPPRWGLLALALCGVLCLHTAANLLNDVFDHRRGLDRDVHPHSGAVVRGWIGERQALLLAGTLLPAGLGCGLALYAATDAVTLWLGLSGIALALGYTGPGRCLKYSGWGDPAILAAFGILPVFGSWWLQARVWSWTPVLWSLPLGSLAVAILHANNWRDLATDAAGGCRTTAGRLGESGSRRYYQLLVVLPFVVVALLGAARHLGACRVAPAQFAWPLAALPVALRLVAAARRPGAPPEALDARTAHLQGLFALLTLLVFLPAGHGSTAV